MRIEVFPRFSVHITIDEFHAIDLVHGYYQIRFRFKPNVPFSSKLTCDQKPTNSPQSRPAVHFETGVSRPIKVAFAEQTVELLDVFRATLDVHKRFDRFESCPLEIQMELWYLDPENKPLPENYTFVSKRLITVFLRPDRSVHHHRPVFFEYYSFSAVSLTIHASVTDCITIRTKSLPDPSLNGKLASYHRAVFTRLFGCCLSLQTFIKKHGAEVLTSPLKIACVDVEQEVADLQTALSSHQQPWQLLQDQIKTVCDQLTRLFVHLVQLFNCNRALSLALLDEFDQQRMKRFAEGFLFVEDTVKSLLHPTENISGRIFLLIKKSGYLNKMPNSPIRVNGTDVDSTNVSLILEHRYLPTGATVFSSDDTTTGESNSQRIPKINAEVSSFDQPPGLPPEFSSDDRPAGRSQFMCFPLRSSSKLLPDDSYGTSDKNDYFLDPTATDRWGSRRMTDPCCAVHVEEVETSDLLEITTNGCNPNATFKSKSFSNIAAETQNGKQEDVPSTSASSSTGSLARATAPQSPQKTEQVMSPINDKLLLKMVDQERVVFVEQKELLKQRLAAVGFRGYFFSDQASFINRRPYFSTAFNEAVERRNLGQVHLVVFVHGLEGTSEDLSAYRNSLRIALPETNFAFLLSETNQTETWSDLNKMSENLLAEILKFIQRMPQKPRCISFIAHSLGGLIVRAMCGLDGMKPLLSSLWTFLSLNSPHAGLLYMKNAANLGISFLKWFKSSISLEQLLLKDNVDIHETFLYKLSQNGAFSHFRHVLLVGSQSDLYVPCHSALLETCKEATKDPSNQSACYQDMLTHINESIISSPRHTTLVKYTVLHSLANVSRAHQITGRAVHVASIDDDSFIEKLLSISASKYFQ